MKFGKLLSLLSLAIVATCVQVNDVAAKKKKSKKPARTHEKKQNDKISAARKKADQAFSLASGCVASLNTKKQDDKKRFDVYKKTDKALLKVINELLARIQQLEAKNKIVAPTSSASSDFQAAVTESDQLPSENSADTVTVPTDVAPPAPDSDQADLDNSISEEEE